MKRLLEQLRDNDTFLELYSHLDDPKKFSVGIIRFVSDECVVLAKCDISGEPDGYLMVLLDDVAQVCVESPYLNALEPRFRAGYDAGCGALPELSTVRDCLHYCISLHRPVSLQQGEFASIQAVALALIGEVLEVLIPDDGLRLSNKVYLSSTLITEIEFGTRKQLALGAIFGL